MERSTLRQVFLRHGWEERRPEQFTKGNTRMILSGMRLLVEVWVESTGMWKRKGHAYYKDISYEDGFLRLHTGKKLPLAPLV